MGAEDEEEKEFGTDEDKVNPKKFIPKLFVKLVTKRMGGTLKLCRILPPFSSQSSVAAKVASCPSVTNRFLTHIKEITSLSSGYCMVVFISDTDRQIEAISISFLSLLMPMHTRNQFVCETSSAAGSLSFLPLFTFPTTQISSLHCHLSLIFGLKFFSHS